VRGALWSCDKLNAAYLKPYTGPQGRFETLAAPEKPAKEAEGGDVKKSN
jgi:hypothetical protein